MAESHTIYVQLYLDLIIVVMVNDMTSNIRTKQYILNIPSDYKSSLFWTP